MLIFLSSSSLISEGNFNLTHKAYTRAIASLKTVDLSQYKVFNGGLVDIPNGSYVQGSADHGGIQPDYQIDYNSPEFDSLKEYARLLKEKNYPLFKKVEWLQHFINQEVIRNKSYNDPKYIDLVTRYRRQRLNIPLSQYRICSSGVCREHALVFHMALKEAGIENFHVYAKVFQGDRIEDHAFNVIRHEGEDWVVDCYNRYFNGFRLKDLMDGNNTNVKSAIESVRNVDPNRGIVKINDFPKIYVPKNAEYKKYPRGILSCLKLLSSFF